MAFKFGKDGPVNLWVPYGVPREQVTRVRSKLKQNAMFFQGTKDVPSPIISHLSRGGKLIAHNAAFERKNLNGHAGSVVNFPKLKIEQTVCTMAKMRVHGLPGRLEDAAEALGVTPKDKAGHADMLYLCKPRKDGTFCSIEEQPERFGNLFIYNVGDVIAESEADEIVPDLTPRLQRVYEMDQRINDRGWQVDVEALENVMFLIKQYKQELDARCRSLTITAEHTKGIGPTRAAELANWVRTHGFPELENLQAPTVLRAMKLDLPDNIKAVLKVYSTYNMKAVSKFEAMRRSLCRDGRLHGMFIFYGANTGRWSSGIVQLQNLFRPVKEIGDPDVAIDVFKARDLEWVRTIYAGVDPMKVFASTVRGTLVAANGKDLLFPDYAGIESRWNAWMFNEEWKLNAFREYDNGVGANLYCVVYGRCFNVDPSSKEGAAGKQTGKVIDLSMGYEGGVGALKKMATAQGVDLKEMTEKVYPTLPEDVLDEALYSWEWAVQTGRTYDIPQKIWVTCDSLKRLWRRSHPNITQGWDDLRHSAILAVNNPGKIYGLRNKRVLFKVHTHQGHSWLYMRLPSGRYVAYYKPFVKLAQTKEDKAAKRPGKETLYYYGINTVTRQWGLTSTYGGKLCENETQAGCAELLMDAKLGLQDAGYPLIGSVHDEPVMEVDKGFGSLEYAGQIMCQLKDWARGLPVAIEGHRKHRYRK